MILQKVLIINLPLLRLTMLQIIIKEMPEKMIKEMLKVVSEKFLKISFINVNGSHFTSTPHSLSTN